MKKIGFGTLWFLGISMGLLILGGVIVGLAAGINDHSNGETAGRVAGEAFGEEYTGIIFLFSLIVSVVGSFMGWLPGTKVSTT